MKNRIFWTTVLAVAFTLICLPASAQIKKTLGTATMQAAPLPPPGKEEPCISNPCLFYAGDYDDNGPGANALWNGYNPSVCIFGVCGARGTVYIPFTVPRKYKGARGKTSWQVEGIFVNSLLEDVGSGIAIPSAEWSIVQGVTAKGLPAQLKTICSGTGVPQVTPTGRNAGGLPEYTILLTGLSCPILSDGTYWMTLVPTTEAYPYLTDVEDNTPTNTQGPGVEPVDQAFWYSPDFFVYSFVPTAPDACGTDGCDLFSAGITGVAVK